MLGPASVTIGLSAVVMAVIDGELAVLTVQPEGASEPGLPSGPFDPRGQRTFELALRAFVDQQTGLALGYVEQLYTFGDAGRDTPRAALGSEAWDAGRIVSVGYLALAREAGDVSRSGARWRPWSEFFPYEDRRQTEPGPIERVIWPGLEAWADGDASRLARAEALFPRHGRWRDERVLERYELLYEAGLATEAGRDRGQTPAFDAALGEAMRSDHRRILATALGRLRGKLRYRPVLLDLTPDLFTLSGLQRVAEAVAGLRLHKQNFRRGVERTGLIEDAGLVEPGTGGRPAALFRRRPAAPDAETLGVSLPSLR